MKDDVMQSMLTIPAIKFRKNLGEYLSRTQLTGETFLIERAGKPVAALVSIRELQLLRDIAKDKALAFLENRESAKTSLSDKAVEKRSVEAVRKVRKEKK